MLFAGTVVINIAVVATMYLHLTAAQPSRGDVWPGSVTAGIAATLIQHFGTMIVVRITSNASDTYGQFAVVLGLVTWLSLLAIATIMSAELNAALVRLREGSLARRAGRRHPALSGRSAQILRTG